MAQPRLPRRSLSAALLLLGLTAWADADPKYGPGVVRLQDDPAHLRCAPAPDYWALSPYYVSQPDGQTCSAAAVAMAVNALRSRQALEADDPLATVSSVLETVHHADWKGKLTPQADGVSLDELCSLIPRVGAAFELHIHARVIRLDDERGASLEKLRALLQENERSAEDLLLVNYLQSAITGDPEGAVGHFAPVAAYDAAADRVLLLDPDREWYEPYWASTAQLLDAVNTRDLDSGRARGLILISRTAPADLPAP